MNKQPQKPRSNATARAALLFGSGTLTSRILGLIRDSLIFSLLPIDMKDAWIAAFRLPNFFRRFLGEGGLSVSFIPVYVSLMAPENKEERKALTDGLFTLLISTVLLICGVSFLLMDQIIPLWLGGEGFAQVPGKMEMTIMMAQVMILFLACVTLFAFFMALLNSHKQFGYSGYAPLFLNLSIICGLYFYQDSPQLAKASVWSVVIGGLLQALFLLPSVVRLGILPRFSLQPINSAVKKVLTKFLPTVFGVGVLQILALVNVYFASRVQGAVSYIYLGDRLLELPLSLIAVSIGTTLLPTLSTYWSRGETQVFLNSLSKQLSLFYFLAIPSAFGLWFLGFDIIDVLFKRGEFTLVEAAIVGDLLKIYCLTLLAAGSLKILNQALYATGDTLTPAIISCFGLMIHLLLAPFLMEKFSINGLVLSTAVVSLFNFICCLWVIQKKIGPLKWKAILQNALSCVFAGSVMGAVLVFINQHSWKQGRVLLDLPILLFIIAVVGGVYFFVAALFRVEELNFLLRRFKK